MAIIKDINLLFAGTNAESAALDGWTRNTTFDTYYIVGCSSTDTTGGTYGGESTHTHAISSTHTHSLSTPSSPESNNDNSGAATMAAPGHGHSSVNLSANSPTVATADNEPPYYRLIVIKSLGTSLNVPAKSIIIGDTSQYDPSPFSSNLEVAGGAGGIPNIINTAKYFPRGAVASGDSGGTGGSSTHKHNYGHSHTTPVTSGASSNDIAAAAVRGSGLIASHTHGVTITNVGTAGYYNSVGADGNPPNIIAVPWYVNTDTPLETGMIAMWPGLKSAIPDNWAEVTAYRDYFVRFNGGTSTFYQDEEGNYFYSYDDIGTTGGADQHTHTSSHAHIGTTASVTGNQYIQYPAGTTKVAAYTHTHNWAISSSDANFSNNTSKSNYPPYIKVFFIKYTAPTHTQSVLYDSDYYDSELYGD